MTDFFFLLASKIRDVLATILPSTMAFAAVFAVLTLFPSLACNRGKPWWRNRGLLTDLCYCFVLPFFIPYMRLALLILGFAFVGWFVDAKDFGDTFGRGYGPFARLPLWAQAIVYLVLSDFLMYWLHRVFHGKRLWPYHAVHHSAEDVDWTTAYRFHPVNLWLDAYLVDAILLFMGMPVVALALMVPFNTVTSAFVHANLNWTLGPLKHVFASPVFHRWHHTSPEFGGDKNFASTFSLWDVLFGTFYMPEGKLPEAYGVDDPNFPASLAGQLAYPFRRPTALAETRNTVPSSASLRRQ
jgi:sterol desaturase/sphingolipid hydroxylase (fatty acid hydroxylase superfamily)